MFNKVLIANRGAIACRIIRTLKEMGVGSVVVYTDVDRGSLHVSQADEAINIGSGPASDSYLNMDKVLQAAIDSGAEAIHPGYGFLSENATFCDRCSDAGIAFIGPTSEQLLSFGLKHTARKLAIESQVPLLPGSELLQDIDEALREAERIGYPVMLKSTAGGGGIGMRLVWNETELKDAYDSVHHLAQSNFSDAGLYLEKFVEHARHIEVQVFGDGAGNIITLGERDCSIQRRNQKVIEETPAPLLSDAQRQNLQRVATQLMQQVNYRSAGTVEFVMDVSTQAFYFLEVNTRLQVEHGVTEEIYQVDLVRWMIDLAAGEFVSPELPLQASGHSIQVRLYAEDPIKSFQPSTGILTDAYFDTAARVETWIETGSEISAFYDPMLAKIIVTAPDRMQALTKMSQCLSVSRMAGLETNLEYLQQIVASETFGEGTQTTQFLNSFAWLSQKIEVIQSGVQTAVQDVLGRQGYWDVGVPPSGAIDGLSLNTANQLLDNPFNTAGLECVVTGPTLRFHCNSQIAITGGEMACTLDGEVQQMWQTITVNKGQTLVCGNITSGCRSYIAIKGGIAVPEYLDSQATFSLGQFGGHAGRNLLIGDMLPIKQYDMANDINVLPIAQRPKFDGVWQIAVMYGPHGAPDFFTDADVTQFFGHEWEVHHNSSRTGIRLVGPKPEWAREDGGEAGLHPSNIHDNAYAVGAIDFTGDMPIILGPDGPSLGGFVCLSVIVAGERWKMGQLKAGDRVQFVPINYEQAAKLHQRYDDMLRADHCDLVDYDLPITTDKTTLQTAILDTSPINGEQPAVVYRPAGDSYLLVEYGEQVLDLQLRFRVQALMEWLQAQQIDAIIDLTPGIRSLLVHYHSLKLSQTDLLAMLKDAENALPDIKNMQVPSRIVHLPMAWADSQTKLATEKYQQLVYPDAPWCPDNIEFIRRINGLASAQAVKDIVYDASYLVMGLGDVYLGAPVATPLDPRHRLVTTKYNPARTWTPENAVGIGGAYMCIYGMEGPGGYQFVGRTLQIWNRYRSHPSFQAEKPWLLRFFDQIRFYEVSEEKLLSMRTAFKAGELAIEVEDSVLNLAEYYAMLNDNKDSIQTFKDQQQANFDAERQRWKQQGLDQYIGDNIDTVEVLSDITVPEGGIVVNAHMMGSVWKISCAVGDVIDEGQTLAIIEAMKIEIPIVSPVAMQVVSIEIEIGMTVKPEQPLFVLAPVAVNEAQVTDIAI
ncbi:urea carboxylase [Psychrobacter sp. Ps6]|uniref:urea carboxylase n=1 Tax=Psychrobacter sp. Ps6 TaxID=2790960 RepID=UPI001EE0BF3F|nr:urea carboxylase [Psychrobacter sp. Ps6]MCG3878031.1 urea carboxylase [Psychrobacter sp. Ps6]